jgi:hypothetical protein
MPSTPAPADCPYDWELDRSVLPTGWHAEVWDGERSHWALCPEPDIPAANAATGFCIVFARKYPEGRAGWARVHTPDGIVADDIPFTFDGSWGWEEGLNQ